MPPVYLGLDPPDILDFKVEGKEAISRNLELENTSGVHVAYKVKTTAPKSYLVRPSNGTLKPGERATIDIIVQNAAGGTIDYDKHRFLVQSVEVKENQVVDKNMWNEIDKNAVHEKKLNVTMEYIEERGGANKMPPASRDHGSQRPAIDEPSQDSQTDLKTKYDELVQYTLMLENEKKKLQAEKSDLERTGRGAASASGGYGIHHVIGVMLLTFLLSYMAKFLG